MLKKFFLTKLTSFKQSSFVKSLLFILPLFFLSRAILLLIAWFSQYFVASSYPDANLLEKGWLFHPQYYLDVWGRWDSGWYMRIVQEGYQLKGTWAFFPLYPLLINALAFLLPIAKTAGVFFIIGLIISNFSAILALALFHQLTFIISKNKKVAQLSIYYLLTFPTAFVLSSFYTESLFLLISFGFFIALEKKHYYLGALLGGGGSDCAFTGAIALHSFNLSAWTRLFC